jgi:hypothetical protein
MTADPLLSSALLGSARLTALPPAPDPSLEAIWVAIPMEDPASALLQALALTRALHRAGKKSREVSPEPDVCPPETRTMLSASAAEAGLRMVEGEFPEVLPEWLTLAVASGKVLPSRTLAVMLGAATKSTGLRKPMAALAGERGRWLARRHSNFSWLLGESTVDDSAWDHGNPSERLAWLRQTRRDDPAKARDAVVAQWAGEEPSMREAIVRVFGESATPEDEVWLESVALVDRRQEIRERAISALMGITNSGFQCRARERLAGMVKLERKLVRRHLVVEPPTAHDASWTTDGVKAKAPQGTGEKAWWLRQLVANLPLSEWPDLLGCRADELFQFPNESDWKDPLLLGWMDAVLRRPDLAMPALAIPYFAAIEPWPPGAMLTRLQVLGALLEATPEAERGSAMDQIAPMAPAPLVLELLIRLATPITGKKGKAALKILHDAIASSSSILTRPQARTLALCVPRDEIPSRLAILASLPNLSSAAEEFARVLEFRRNLDSMF